MESREGANVSITGGQSIAPCNFTRFIDEQILRRLTQKAVSHVWQADLAALGIRDYGKHQQYGHGLTVCPAPLELFFKAAPMTLAREHGPKMFDESGLLRERLLKSVNILAPPYSTKYPELKNHLDPIVPGLEWEGMRSRLRMKRSAWTPRGSGYGFSKPL